MTLKVDTNVIKLTTKIDNIEVKAIEVISAKETSKISYIVTEAKTINNTSYSITIKYEGKRTYNCILSSNRQNN